MAQRLLEEDEIEQYWTAEARKLVGHTIVKAEYMSPTDADGHGWGQK